MRILRCDSRRIQFDHAVAVGQQVKRVVAGQMTGVDDFAVARLLG